MDASQLALAATAGLFSGFINAVAGGGSLVLFPALLACGLQPLEANVTNSMANWPGYIGGVYGFRHDLADQGVRWRRLTLITLIGSSLGCALLLRLPASAFDLIVPVLVFFSSLMLALQPRLKKWAGSAGGERWRFLVVGVLAAAVYGGYFGGALGVILLGTLALGLADSLRRLNALKAALSLVNGTVSLIVFALFGPVYWPAAWVAAPATLLGGYWGARLASRINDGALRWAIVAYGLVVSVYLFLK
ncbi:MAG: sulfite exporter TauE/SafE family protein [Candidatus Eremiobacteraeota bacterium]|nr:sulfite exporter TauE/SafE family protein [Candidatus Eremiobacteraeota bacterium]MCW5866112.1 sulfite exporter TauE/SafE family protein [Candidatus Eremiobacteraeota bacterium]